MYIQQAKIKIEVDGIRVDLTKNEAQRFVQEVEHLGIRDNTVSKMAYFIRQQLSGDYEPNRNYEVEE